MQRFGEIRSILGHLSGARLGEEEAIAAPRPDLAPKRVTSSRRPVGARLMVQATHLGFMSPR